MMPGMVSALGIGQRMTALRRRGGGELRDYQRARDRYEIAMLFATGNARFSIKKKSSALEGE
jgi:hypothetical protein